MNSAPMAESPPGLDANPGRRRGLAWLLPALAALLLSLFLFLSARDAQPEPLLRVGANRWPGYDPLYLARDLHLYDSSRIPGRILDVLVVERAVAEHHPACVRYLLQGYFAALAQRDAEPKRVSQLMAARQPLPEQELGRLVQGFGWVDRDGNGRYLAAAEPRLRNVLADLSAYQVRKELLRQPVALDGDLADGGYLPEAAP